MCLTFTGLHLKAVMFLYAFEESVDCHLVSSFCDDSNLHISLFKYVLSTMGVNLQDWWCVGKRETSFPVNKPWLIYLPPSSWPIKLRTNEIWSINLQLNKIQQHSLDNPGPTPVWKNPFNGSHTSPMSNTQNFTTLDLTQSLASSRFWPRVLSLQKTTKFKKPKIRHVKTFHPAAKKFSP